LLKFNPMDSVEEELSKLKEKVAGLEQQINKKDQDFKVLFDKTNSYVSTLFNSSNDLIQIIAPDGSIKFVNQTWKYKLGYREEELEQLKFIDIVHPDHKKASLEKLMLITAGSESEHLETVLIGKYGKNIYVNGEITCVFENDQPIEYRCLLYDITERARAESAQSLYYKIAHYTHQGETLELLYQQIFNELSSHLQVRNFSIVLFQDEHLSYPIRIIDRKAYSQEVDDLLSAYTLERKKPLIVYQDGIKKISEQHQQKISGELPKIWLGVPFEQEEVKGVMMMYSFRDQAAFNHKDLELLDFISGMVALALERTFNKQKIKLQGARLIALFESSTHQIWSIDRSFSFTSFNENYARSFFDYFGKRPELGMSLKDSYQQLYDDQMQVFWLEKYKEAYQGKNLNFETRIKNANNETVWREVFINPIVQENGRIDEVSVIANDITEKYQASLALKDSEEKFRNIFESFQDIYFRCNLDGEITMVSPSVREVLGYEPANVLGQNIAGFFISKETNDSLLKKLYQQSSIKNFEGATKTSNGEHIDFLCNVRLIRNPWDQGGEIEGVARDISRLKRANSEIIQAKDMAERSLKIKERFLANMSHEIRTPMNGIIGMIDLLGATPLNDEQSEYIRTIKKSSDTLLEILNDILDLSKIEAGKMRLKLKPVKLIDTIEKVYDLYSQQAYKNNTSLYYHIDDTLPEYVSADETRLLQVISNLTSNAIKFSQKKGIINIGIRVIDHKKNNFTFRVAVKDSGIGIHPDDQKKLFVSFNQLDSSNKKQFAGTGLGLAISKELVKSMNGEIGVVSTPGFGSTFWFTFDASKTEKPAQEEREILSFNDDHFSEHPPKILLVDDNDINRKVAGRILSISGCIVEEASSGPVAVKLASEQPFDLIFMDIQMPEMDGLETTEIIRSLPLERVPPIIAMTAYSMEEDKEKFISQGMDDYLPKPIKSHLLIEKVKQWTKSNLEVVDSSVFEEKAQELIINQNTLNQLHKYGGKELIVSVLEDFKKEAIEQVNESLHAIKSEDYNAINRLMHTLKGNAGTLGIEKVSKQADTIEKKIKENKFSKIARELNKLTTALDEFIDSYKNIIKNE
jgi:PAS domain S-box-containing protein